MNKLIMKIKKSFANFNFKNAIKTFYKDTIKEPLFLMIHPIRGWDEFKRDKVGKNSTAIYFMLMMILAEILLFNNAGFLVNTNILKEFNLPLTVALVVFTIILVTISNWSCTALMDGKGKMNEIFKVICYSLFPYIILSIAGVIISNYITNEEVVIYKVLLSAAAIFTGYMIFFGLMMIHEYGLLKTIAMIICTIVAIAVVLFIILLFFSLIQQFYAFCFSVYREFKIKYL